MTKPHTVVEVIRLLLGHPSKGTPRKVHASMTPARYVHACELLDSGIDVEVVHDAVQRINASGWLRVDVLSVTAEDVENLLKRSPWLNQHKKMSKKQGDADVPRGTCTRCGRRLLITDLNIEGRVHHHAPLECKNRKACERTRRHACKKGVKKEADVILQEEGDSAILLGLQGILQGTCKRKRKEAASKAVIRRVLATIRRM